jgi:hypothetical protein
MKSLQSNPELKYLAKRYVWWEVPEWAFDHPEIFLANTMNLASWEDMQLLQKICKKELLKQVLKEAPPGYFSHRSWDYWHLKLGFKQIPPLPKRKFL